MNKFLLIISAFLFLSTVILYENGKNKIEAINPFNAQEIKQINISLNEKNKKINQIQADLCIEQDFIKLQGYILYEKPNNFKMIANSIFGKEIEIGSNDNYFWFWARYLKPKALYYCDVDSVEKTRLRKIFHPEILKSFLCVDQIEYDEVRKEKEFLYFIKNIKTNNEQIKKITVVKDNKICKIALYSKEVLLLNADITNADNKILISIYWAEEKIFQKWTLTNIKINKKYNNWSMPNYSPKIDILYY
jgi:hypothetical protein